MIDGKYRYEGIGYINGMSKMLTIDCSKLGSGYECMVLRPDGIDIDCKYADNIEDAEKIYNAMIKRYTTPPVEEVEKPLTGKYKKLSDDLKIAYEMAKEFDQGEDGGTCNFDSPSLYLPRWIEKKVKQAAKEAGTSAWKWDLYGKAHYVIHPPTHGQANRRSRVSEAMCKILEDMGYDVFEYSAMD